MYAEKLKNEREETVEPAPLAYAGNKNKTSREAKKKIKKNLKICV